MDLMVKGKVVVADSMLNGVTMHLNAEGKKISDYAFCITIGNTNFNMRTDKLLLTIRVETISLIRRLLNM